MANVCLARNLSWWACEGRLRIETPSGAFALEGDSAAFMESLLNASQWPVSKPELLKLLAAEEEFLDEAVEFLLAHQVLVRTEEESPPAFSQTLEAMLQQGVGSSIPLKLYVSFDSIGAEDEVTSVATLPVILNGPEAWVGGCAQCLRLRIEGHESPVQFKQRQDIRQWAKRFGSSDWSSQSARSLLMKNVSEFVDEIQLDGSFRGVTNPVWEFRAEQPDGVVHRLFQHSYCPHCRNKQRPESLRLYDESPPPSALLLNQYRDARVGLFNYAEEFSKKDNYFNELPVCWGGFNLIRGKDYASTGQHGYMGVGETLEEVRLVGASEGFERYALANIPPNLTNVPYAEIETEALNPLSFALYEEAQYAQKGFRRPRFSPTAPLHWVKAESLVSGERKWVPWEFVVSSLPEGEYSQRLIDQYFSTGGASHTSYARAAINGIREVIERDAFMICWYKKIRLPQVKLPRRLNDAYADSLLKFLDEKQISVTVLDLRLDFRLPAFLTVASSRVTQGCWPQGGVVLSATCDVSPLRALTRGLREIALHFETLVVNPTPERDHRRVPFDENDETSGWRDWIPNYLQYLSPEFSHRTDFLSTGGEVDFESLPSFSTGHVETDFRGLLAELSSQGLEPWACDLVTPDIQPSGFKVLKVLVPGMVDLTPARQSRRLGSARVEHVARKTGRALLPEGETNPHSHPNA